MMEDASMTLYSKKYALIVGAQMNKLFVPLSVGGGVVWVISMLLTSSVSELLREILGSLWGTT